jgi:hypothetical protein
MVALTTTNGPPNPHTRAQPVPPGMQNPCRTPSDRPPEGVLHACRNHYYEKFATQAFREALPQISGQRMPVL